jgi:hypothetical protein
MPNVARGAASQRHPSAIEIAAVHQYQNRCDGQLTKTFLQSLTTLNTLLKTMACLRGVYAARGWAARRALSALCALQ